MGDTSLDEGDTSLAMGSAGPGEGDTSLNGGDTSHDEGDAADDGGDTSNVTASVSHGNATADRVPVVSRSIELFKRRHSSSAPRPMHSSRRRAAFNVNREKGDDTATDQSNRPRLGFIALSRFHC